jgi:hypothetical protein
MARNQYVVKLGSGQDTVVVAPNKSEAERRAIRYFLDNGTDPDYLLSLTDSDVKVTRL